MAAVINNPNMGNNTNPVQTPEDVRSKYADYFVTDTNKNLVSVDTFFQLLLAEMTNQDPLEPTSNTEFVSQLASFTALQTNSDSLYYNTISYASSLAGKTVMVATNSTDGNGNPKIDTGVVTGVDISESDDIKITVNGKKYALKNVMNVVDGGSAAGSSGGVSKSDGAYAVSLIGKKALVAGTTEDGETLLDEGIVESVEYQDGEYRVVVNGLSFALDDIVRVREAEAVNGSSTNSDGAYAVSLIGKKVLVAGFSNDGEDAYGEGIVDSIEIVDGEYRVVIEGFSFSLDDVVSVSNADGSTNAGDKTEGDNTETSIMEENEELMKLFS